VSREHEGAAGRDAIAAMLRGRVVRGEVPGVVALLAHRDTVRRWSLGVRDLATGAPMRRDTLFRTASMTKPITAAAAMALVDDGTLALDEPVDRWLPELAGRRVLRSLEGPLDDTVPARRPITLRDLLTLRMGLGAIMAPPGTYPLQRAMAEAGVAPAFDAPPFSPDELVRRLGTLPLAHQPGERWLYHTGAEVLGVLLARAAGRPLEQLLRQRILDPLGMAYTGFTVPEAKLDRLATPYRVEPGAQRLVVLDEPARGPWSSPPVFPGGGGQGGGLVTTADDYLAFARMLLRHGRHDGRQVLAPASVAAMTTDQLTAAQKTASPFYDGFWDGRGWGFGLMVETAPGGDAPGRYGWAGGLGTTFFVDPRADLVGILLIQRLMQGPEPERIATEFLDLAYRSADGRSVTRVAS
jgi:CubicO group peptidase (beta-lactamase class C family)